ncbi:MAG: hypothetical protein GXY42_06100 [Desulfovibrionales bacterium]|nr:hypothetical protein [Desulfovibrionales bacterium]
MKPVGSAHLLGKKFAEFTTQTFMTTAGCARPDVEQEIMRLSVSASLPAIRERQREAVNELIKTVLDRPSEQQQELLRGTPPMKLALVYERVMTALDILTSAAGAAPYFRAPSFPMPEEEFRSFVRTVLLQGDPS